MDGSAHRRDRELLGLVADPRRWRILELLAGSGRTVSDLVMDLGVAQPAVSHHLARLRRAGLVEARVEGRARRYVWTTTPHGSCESGVQDLLRERFRSAREGRPQHRRPLRSTVEVHLL